MAKHAAGSKIASCELKAECARSTALTEAKAGLATHGWSSQIDKMPAR